MKTIAGFILIVSGCTYLIVRTPYSWVALIICIGILLFVQGTREYWYQRFHGLSGEIRREIGSKINIDSNNGGT